MIRIGFSKALGSSLDVLTAIWRPSNGSGIRFYKAPGDESIHQALGWRGLWYSSISSHRSRHARFELKYVQHLRAHCESCRRSYSCRRNKQETNWPVTKSGMLPTISNGFSHEQASSKFGKQKWLHVARGHSLPLIRICFPSSMFNKTLMQLS